jgi:alanyl-tRNA synthetase
MRTVTGRALHLNAQLGFFACLVPTPVDLMEDTFLELRNNEEHVTSIVWEEEDSFSKTVGTGIVEFQKHSKALSEGNTMFQGKDVSFLYTSMGFQMDLTKQMCKKPGLTWIRTALAPI